MPYNLLHALELLVQSRGMSEGAPQLHTIEAPPSLWSAIEWALPTSFWSERLSSKVAISELSDPGCLVLRGLIDMTVTKARLNVFDMK